MYKIDLNSDLGEGAAFDAQIIPLITGANIACGFHAGGSEIMDKTIDLCRASGVDRKSTRLNSSHRSQSRMPSSA